MRLCKKIFLTKKAADRVDNFFRFLLPYFLIGQARMLLDQPFNFQTAQKLFLTEKLEAKLIASSAFFCLVFEPCKYGCGNISH